MISKQYILAAGTHTIYLATEEGAISMLSIVNSDSSDGTLNVYKKGTSQVRIIMKDTSLKIGKGAFLAGRTIKIGQSIIIVTTVEVEVDLNII